MKHALAVLAVLAASPVWGQACLPRAVLIERLADGYGEGREAVALTADGRMLEIFANLETGSWTIALTVADGVSCLVASGENYERVREAAVTGDPT
jgi:hypothetical protein